MAIQNYFNELILQGIAEFIIVALLYLFFAGLAFWFFYFYKKDKLQHKKIQQRIPTKSIIRHEIKYSIYTSIIFGIIFMATGWAYSKGWTKIYLDYSEYGTVYFIFSIIATIFIHDTYFYWGHRFMHLKKVYPLVHQVHHHSINPTPWATFSFHPIEAFIEGGIVPLIAFVLPIHPWALFIFFIFMIFNNVYGHTGYEMDKTGYTTNKKTAWLNSSTHHNMHHSHFNYNYGLYFNFWDKLMGTNHEKYHETFEKIVTSKKKE